MPKPNFFVAGQGKSGTTLLHTILRAHPDIFVANEKETPFFSDETYLYGLPYLEWLHHDNYEGQPLVGDCFSANMFGEEVPERIHACLGSDIRFIFSMRQPIDRAVAHYNMAVRQFREVQSFPEAVKLEARRWSLHPLMKRGLSYIGRGYYARQIEAFQKFFQCEKMLFLIFETAYGPNLESTARQVFEFLGARADLPFASPGIVNPSPRLEELVRFEADAVTYWGKRYFKPTSEFIDRAKRVAELTVTKLEPDYERAIWKTFYADEVKRLEDLIGRDLSIWHARYG